MQKASTFFKLINYLLFIIIWIYGVWMFFKLPEIIPIHFGFDGVPDGYGNRKENWLFLGITSVLFFLCQYLSTRPYAPGLNIPDSLRKNAPLTELFVQTLCFIILLLFGDILFESIQVALQHQTQISNITLALLILLFIVMFAFFFYAHQKEKSLQRVATNLKNNPE